MQLNDAAAEGGFVARMRRRMAARKAASLAAAARAPKPRVRSAEQQVEVHLIEHAKQVENELKAISERVDLIDKYLAGTPPGTATFEGRIIGGGQTYGTGGGHLLSRSRVDGRAPAAGPALP